MTSPYVLGMLVADNHGQTTILQALIEVSFKGIVEPGRNLEWVAKNEKNHSFQTKHPCGFSDVISLLL